jgi:hypothetical protein
MVIIPVAVEKLGFPKKSRKSGDTKCPGDSGKSLVELPNAKQFLRNRSERVFQQPPLFATSIQEESKALVLSQAGWVAVVPSDSFAVSADSMLSQRARRSLSVPLIPSRLSNFPR